MGSHSVPVDSDPAYPDWHDIEDVLDELAQVAKSTLSLSLGDFYRLVIQRIVPAAGVSGGAIWTAGSAGELRLECHLDLVDSPGRLQAGTLTQHQDLVEQVLASGQPRIAPLANNPAESTDTAHADGWAVLQPFRTGPRSWGVIELVQRRPATPAERNGLLRLLAAAVELTDDFHRNHELARLRAREQGHGELERFALRAHRSLDAAETAFLIANEGRRAIGCDRLSVLVRAGRSYRTVAVSGVDVLERRSKLVRALERLVARAATADEPQWYSEDSADLPDEVEGPLQAYLDEGHARVLAVVPLASLETGPDEPPAPVVGALVAEQFHSTARDGELRERVAAVAVHSGVALANALAHSHMPLARLARVLSRVRWLAEPRQLPKTLVALGAAVVAAAALTFIPADFDIEARGELQPAVRREVFASDDGVVSELLADHGRAVRSDEPLVVLRKPDLDLELRRVAGEIQTAEKKLAAVQAERLTNDRTPDDKRRDAHQLTADEEELKELVRGLTDERQILEQQRADLVIRSPIDGQALTWNLKELLAARPVERGQALLTVADLDGPWVAELHLADHRTGHVLAARDELRPDLDVSFALASDPGQEYHGQIADIALATDIDEAEEPTVLVTVKFNRDEVAGLRPGATVLAKIHCGRRALGYVWLHDLLEFVQTHWWW